MRIDVVIPVLNSVDMTWRCYQHLKMYAANDLAGIILVDDGSTDSTPHLGAHIERMMEGQYIRHPKNLGVQAAWNSGLKAARTDYVLFINNDVAIFPLALHCMASFVEATGRPYVSATEIRGRWDPALILKRTWDDRHRIIEVRDGDAFGGCFLMRRDFLREIGGFDERFFLTYGDTDMIERMRDRGCFPCVALGAIAYHGVSMTRRRELGGLLDIEHDAADYQRFAEKWAHRADVMARYPSQSVDEMNRARWKWWSDAESI